MICYIEPNFVEICLQESGFSIFCGIAQSHGRKIGIKNGRHFETLHFFQLFFFADNHNLTYFINGANFIWKFHWESGFLRRVHRNPPPHTLGTNGWEKYLSYLSVNYLVINVLNKTLPGLSVSGKHISPPPGLASQGSCSTQVSGVQSQSASVPYFQLFPNSLTLLIYIHSYRGDKDRHLSTF